MKKLIVVEKVRKECFDELSFLCRPGSDYFRAVTILYHGTNLIGNICIEIETEYLITTYNKLGCKIFDILIRYVDNSTIIRGLGT